MSKHDWECISPGLYDDSYECQKCGDQFSTSVDDPGSRLPVNGCVNTTPTDTERLDWVLGHLSIEVGQTTRGIWYYEYYPADEFEAVRTTGASIRECIDKAMDEEQ